MACGGVKHETRQCKRELPRAAIHFTACLGRGHRGAFETQYCPAWRDAHAAAEQELLRLLAPPYVRRGALEVRGDGVGGPRPRAQLRTAATSAVAGRGIDEEQ